MTDGRLVNQKIFYKGVGIYASRYKVGLCMVDYWLDLVAGYRHRGVYYNANGGCVLSVLPYTNCLTAWRVQSGVFCHRHHAAVRILRNPSHIKRLLSVMLPVRSASLWRFRVVRGQLANAIPLWMSLVSLSPQLWVRHTALWLVSLVLPH